jgi:hypothetical protein
MSNDLPMREVRRRLLWVEFLAPLSEAELMDLLRGASFVRLEAGEEMVVGPQEHAERMLLVVAGQLQVFEIALSSKHELTLSVLGGEGDGANTPLDSRPARTSSRTLCSVQRGARRPGGAHACQPGGGA